MKTSANLEHEITFSGAVGSGDSEKQKPSTNGLACEHFRSQPILSGNVYKDDTKNQPKLPDSFHSGLNDQLTKAFIPDLFKSFLAEPPRISPHYHEVKAEAEADYFKLFNFSDKQQRVRESARFPLLMSIVFPEESKREELRTQADHFYWYFDFDDRFDEGELSNDPAAAKAAIETALEALREDGRVTVDPARDPLNYVHQTIWHRVYRNSTNGASRRWRQAMQDYIRSVGDATKSNEEIFEDPATFIKARIHNIGVESFFPMIEYAYGLDLPDSFFDSPSVVGLHELCCEIITLQNEILSYHKEHRDGITRNLVHILRNQHFTQQQAYDWIGARLDELYCRWTQLCSTVPRYFPKIDQQVDVYLSHLQLLPVGSLHWHFSSERYFGGDGARVRRTREVPLLDFLGEQHV